MAQWEVLRPVEDHYHLQHRPYEHAAARGDLNLNTRYISTAMGEEEIDLQATHQTLVKIDREIQDATQMHNAFLAELGLPPLPPCPTLGGWITVMPRRGSGYTRLVLKSGLHTPCEALGIIPRSVMATLQQAPRGSRPMRLHPQLLCFTLPSPTPPGPFPPSSPLRGGGGGSGRCRVWRGGGLGRR